MIIGTCGFGSTGSSAISDYLSEYEDKALVLDRVEFTWVDYCDGLIDLEHHLFHTHCRTIDSIVALRRYQERADSLINYYCDWKPEKEKLYRESVTSFLESITMVKWPWCLRRDLSFKERLREKIFREYTIKKEIKSGLQLEEYPNRIVSYSMKPENFYESAKKHVKEILTVFGADDFTKDIVLDQPFSGNNPQAAFPFYEDPVAFVVDRDPRDLFCFARTQLAGRNHFMPVNNVKDYVVYYKTLREGQPYLEENDRILRLRFEDMVYNYEETTSRIREFLEYPENPNPKKYFDPALSIANTQVYKRFPQFAKEVEFIEYELKDYLFDFDNYDTPQNTKMFSEQSPLKKRNK